MVRQKEGLCPCESGQIYNKCCGPLLAGIAYASTAEALMRSRYTAYIEENVNYLAQTWHPDYRPRSMEMSKDHKKWLGLKIKSAKGGETGAGKGVVEFVARFKVGGKGHRLHEISQFVREGGRWYYTSGETLD